MQPGLIVLFGSGETMSSSTKTHERVAQALGERPRVAILEIPAGFEPNSDDVARKLAEGLGVRIQNHKPQMRIIAARKKGTAHSPDDPALVDPLLEANWLFLGPGSPTYAVKQLRDSRAYENLLAAHAYGATLMLASAASLSFGRFTIPVYEIYKVGEDLHWKDGLDLFGQFGVSLVVVPHWNNNDGGSELDTSRCYMGRMRFDALRAMLPADHTILGLDEHTSVVIDPGTGKAEAVGAGRVTVLRGTEHQEFQAGSSFPLSVLGNWSLPENPAAPADAMARAAAAQAAQTATLTPPDEVLLLVDARRGARQQKDWTQADRLRDEILALGWEVVDTPSGAELTPHAE